MAEKKFFRQKFVSVSTCKELRPEFKLSEIKIGGKY